MITTKLLAASGYRPNKMCNPSFPYSDSFWQRKLTDENGIKYFIEFVHYPKGSGLKEAWMMNMNINEPHCTFQIHRAGDINKAEVMCEEVWRATGGIYYERNQ